MGRSVDDLLNELRTISQRKHTIKKLCGIWELRNIATEEGIATDSFRSAKKRLLKDICN